MDPSLLLVMPDHLHMVASFGRDCDMVKVVTPWKRYIATKQGVIWQRGFFEHRLRAEESVEEKATYILQNPVRVGLVQKASAWPWMLMLDLGGNERQQKR